MTSLLRYLLETIKATGIQLFILVVPLLVLALAMNYVSLLTQLWAVNLVGFKAWMILFKSIGTPIHEIGHAIFCLLFGHSIQGISLFHPSPDGTLGYVEHRFNRRNIYHQIGNFFIGLGPILFGCIVITLGAYFFLGESIFSPIRDFATRINFQFLSTNEFMDILGTTLVAVLRTIFVPDNFQRWQFYIFIYLVFALGNSITLSFSDLRSAGYGFLFLILFFLVLNGVTLWMGDFFMKGILKLNSILIQFEIFMLIALLLNILAAIVLVVFLSGKCILARIFSR